MLMCIVGLVCGYELLCICYSLDGICICGIYNNCFNGFIFWGIYFICEENWVGYFFIQDSELLCELICYGICNISCFGWEILVGDEFECFDVICKGKQVQDDYCNELNNFGWIVEIDLFDL